jgi:hypothetical protein
LGAAAILLVACEVPEAPEWDVGLSIPFSSDPITVVDFLPDTVDVDTVGGTPVFTVGVQADSVEYTLGQMCPACGVLQGATTTVPTFDYQDSLDVPFPAELVSVELISAQLGLFMDNGLNFDPLRPGNGGFIAIAVRDMGSGALLDSVFVDGNSETLPAYTRKQIDLSVADASISQGLRVWINVHSPSDGQTVTIDNNLGARFGAVLDQILVSAIVAVVDTETLDEDFLVDVDADLRDEIADNVQSAVYELELTHGFELAGTLEVSIAGSQADLFSGDSFREVRLGPLSFTSGEVQTGSLTPAEIQQIADYVDVYVGYRGVASGTGAGATSRFAADQSLETNFRLTASVRVGG